MREDGDCTFPSVLATIDETRDAVNASARETLLLSLCGTSTEVQTQHVVSKRLGSNPCAIHIPSHDGVANRSRSSSPVPYAVSLINAVGDDCAKCEIDNSC